MLQLNTGVNESTLQLFDRTGITDFFDALETFDDLSLRFANVKERFDSYHQKLAFFLFLGGSLSSEDLSDSRLFMLVEHLKQYDVILERAGCVSLSGLALKRYRGVWFLSEVPSCSSTLYFGTDSLGLASRLTPQSGRKALDLCSGPGIQGLILANCGMDVTSVEINPFAVDLCKKNIAINSLDDKIRVLEGNLYSPLRDDSRFSLIVANPPLLPIPDEIPYPFVGDGGQSGLDITLRILKGGDTYLEENGQILLIGMTTMVQGRPAMLSSIRRILGDSGLDACMTILCSYSINPRSEWVQGIAATSYAFAPARYSDISEAVDEVYTRYAAQGVSEVCTFTLRAWVSSSEQAGCVFLSDFSSLDDKRQRIWWV